MHGIPEIYKQKKIHYPSSTFCHHLPLLRRPCYMLAYLMSLSPSWNIRWMNGWMPSHLCRQFSIIHYNGVEIGKERMRVKSTNHWESSCEPLLSKLPTKSFTQHDKNMPKKKRPHASSFQCSGSDLNTKGYDSDLGIETNTEIEPRCWVTASGWAQGYRLGQIRSSCLVFKDFIFYRSW